MFGRTANNARASSVLDYLIGLAQLRTRSSPDLAGLEAVVWLSDLAAADGVNGRFTDPASRGSFFSNSTFATTAFGGGSGGGASSDLPWVSVNPATGDGTLGDETRPHTALYRVLQAKRRRIDDLELRLGLGLLTWRHPSGQVIRRHLLTVPAALHMDPDHRLQLQGLPGSPPIELELDMLPLDVRPGEIKGARRPLQLASGDPFHRGVVRALNQVSRALPGRPPVMIAEGDRGTWSGRFDATDDRPRIELAPAILLRRRSARGAIEALKAIRAQVDEGTALPRLFADVCESSASSPRPVDSVTESSALFPLAANPAQVRILDRLKGTDGVVVQGPPGTGKTQTIANLICHLLAEGKRVLVTAQTSRALAPLRQLLPSELRPLCVSWLGSGREEQAILEGGVRRYLDRMISFDASHCGDAVDRERERLKTCDRREEVLKRRIESNHAARSGRYAVTGSDYAGTPAQMAERLQAESSDIGFVPDDVASQAPAPDVDDVAATIESASALPVTASDSFPVPDAPPTLVEPEAFDGWIRLLADAKSADAARATAPFVATLEGASPESLSEFGAAFRDLKDGVSAIRRRGAPWVTAAMNDIVAGRAARWEELARETDEALGDLPDRARDADRQDVRVPAEGDLDGIMDDAVDLRDHLRNGGRIRRGPFRAPVVQRTTAIWRSARIDGKRCDDERSLGALVQHLSVRRDVLRLRRLWTPLAPLPDGPLASIVAAVQEQRGILQEVQDLAFFQARAQASLREVGRLPDPIWSDPVALEDYAESARAVLSGPARGRAEEELARIGEAVSEWAPAPPRHPAIDRLIVSIASRDSMAYRQSYAELDRARGAATNVAAREARDLRTRRAAPSMHALIHRDHDPSLWRQRVPRLRDAWEHARARTWLTRFLSDHDDQPLIDELQQVREQRRHATERLAAALAWRHALGRLDPERRRHLEGWRQATLLAADSGSTESGSTESGSTGHGSVEANGEPQSSDGARDPATHKQDQAARYRREAWGHLTACRDAIPSWVMPLSTVFRSCEMRPGSFDVAIVDEASQCGPEALALLFLAHRVLVVGDDQQIRPMPIGIERQAVDSLVERHLNGLKHKDAFRPEASLFDHAIRRFPERIVLQEHFRCAPEIIRFSDALCYRHTPLVPLRPRAADLDPVCAQFVPAAVRGGTGASAVNHREAMAVAKKVVECASDARYDGRTFGVITLQGVAQAKAIETELIRALGPVVCEQRRLLCGNAMSFQGDERDVVFLSLVAAPNDVGAPLARADFTQRFNVAASRARDQMWLFHSVTPDQLSEKDLRRRLLEFFLEARAPVAEDRRESVDAIGAEGVVGKRWSPLARSVGAWLAARSISTSAADDAGGDPRDLMVDAPGGRVALLFEDDGSSGGERATRQELLQRSGYRTISVREAGFLLDPALELGPILPPERPPMESAPVISALALEPYGAFDAELPDPTSSPVDLVVDAAIRLIAIEGPVTGQRIHRLFGAATDLPNDHVALAKSLALDECLRLARSSGRVASAADDTETLYALPGATLLRPRARGPRFFSEIPNSELLAIAAQLPVGRADSSKRIAERLLGALMVSEPSADDLARARYLGSQPGVAHSDVELNGRGRAEEVGDPVSESDAPSSSRDPGGGSPGTSSPGTGQLHTATSG